MSQEIDNKIVSLEFDSSKYDKNVDKSIKMTDKLKSSLKFQDVETGFDKINKAIAKVTFSPMEKGIDSVYAKFTMMERFAVQAYDRMANRIIDIGKNIADETFKIPVSSGFSEYEQKMDSINVMMNSTGESLETVNEELEKLNKYADDTIYSFSDMTSSIGKFTNNGVKLQDATKAIMGISNAAALAGSNTQQASSAMYNFSQALSMGYLSLADFKSIELAGMATIKFKEQLMETGLEVGTLTKGEDGLVKTMNNTVVTAGKLRESLSEQWVTNEVLLKTLQKYSDETTQLGKDAHNAATEVRTFTKMVDALKESLQSGWGQTWELLIGNMRDATNVWTSINNVLSGFISRMAATRNGFIKTWKANGGLTAATHGLLNVFRALGAVLNTVKEAFYTVFPPMTGERLAGLSVLFEKLSRKIQPSTRTLTNLQRIFTGLFGAIGIVVDVAKAFGKAMLKPLGLILQTRTGVLETAASFGDWVTKLRQTIKEGKIFETVFNGLANGLSVAINAIKMIAKFIKDLILNFKDKGFTGAFDVIRSAFSALLNHIKGQLDKFDPVSKIKSLGSKIADTIEDWPVIGTVYRFIARIGNVFKESNIFTAIPNFFKSLVHDVGESIDGFKKVKTDAAEDFNDRLSKRFEPIKNMLTGVKNFLSGFFNFMGGLIKMIGTVGKYIFNSLKQVFDGVTETFSGASVSEMSFAAVAATLSTLLLSIAKVMKNTSGILGGVQSIVGSVAKTFNALTTMVNAKMLKEIAIAIAILAGSLVVLAAIPISRLTAATGVITALFFNLVTAMKTYSAGMNSVSKVKVSKEGGVEKEGAAGAMAAMGMQLMLIASAVMVLVSAMTVISLLPYENLVKGVAVIELLLYSIANVARAMTHGEKRVNKKKGTEFKTKSVSVAGTLIAMAIAMNLIVGAVTRLVIMLTILEKVAGADSLKVFGVAIASIVLLMYMAQGLSTALAKAASKMTKDSTGGKAAGIGGMFAGTIISMAIFIRLVMKSFMMLVAEIAGLQAIEEKTGKTDASKAVNKALEAIVAIVGTIIIFMGVFLIALAKLSSMNSGSVGTTVKALGGLTVMMIIMQGFLLELVAALLAITFIAEKFPDGFGAAAIFLVEAMGAISILLFAVSKVIESKQASGGKKGGISKAIKTLAVTFLALSIGLAAMGFAISKLSSVPWKALAKGGVILVAVTAFLTGMVLAVGESQNLQKGLGYLGEILLDIGAAMGIVALSFVGIMAAFKILSKFTDEELDNAINNFKKFLQAMRQLGPDIAIVIGELIAIIVDSLVMSVVASIDSALDGIFEVLLDGLSRAVKYGPEILEKIFTVLNMVLDGIARKAPEIIAKLVVALISIINGLAKAIDDNRKEILDAIDRLFDAVAAVVVEAIGRLLGKEGKELDKFVENWRGAVSKILKVLASLTVALKAFAAVKAMTSTLSVVTSLYDKLKYLPGTIKDAGGAWKFFSQKASYAIGGLKTKIGALSTFSKFALGAGITIAVGSAIANIINNATEAMNVCEKMSDEFQKEAEETARLNEENVQKINDIQKAYKDVDVDYNNAEQYSEKLKECIDSNGQIKAGMEDQAAYYADKLNDVAGLRVEIENGVVTAYDEQNNRIDLQGEKLEELMQKKRLMAKLDAQSEEIEKLRLEVDPGNADSELRKNILKAKEDMENAANDEEQRTAAINYNKALEAYNTAMAQVEAFDQAEQAYISGDQEQIKKASEWLNRGFTDTTDNAYAVVAGINSIKTEQDNLKESLESHMITQEAYDEKTKELTADLEAYLAVLKRIGDENPASILYYDYDVTSGQTNMGRAYGAKSIYGMYKGTYSGPTQSERDATKDTLGWQRRKKKAEEEFKEIQKWYKEVGKNLDASSETDMQDFYAHFAYLSEDVREGLMKQYPQIRKAFEYLGENGAAGFAQAIVNGDAETQEAARSMSESFLDALEGGLDINSPSKETYAIGEYVVDGFVNALTAGQERIKMAAKSMTATLLTAFTGDLGSSPVITPVIGSPITGNILGDFQTMINGMPPLNATVTQALTAGLDISPIVRSNEDLLAEVSLLREDMAAMSYNITNMKMVMDTGALVGQLAGPMDTALGKRAALTRKGAY